jgi:anti-sigma B factor antagonist
MEITSLPDNCRIEGVHRHADETGVREVSMTRMTIRQRLHGEVVTLSLSGSLLSEPDAMNLRQAVYRQLEKQKKYFVIDLGELKYMNSMGLGALVASLISVRNRGGDLCIARVKNKVKGILVITKLDKVFRLYDALDKAIQSFVK